MSDKKIEIKNFSLTLESVIEKKTADSRYGEIKGYAAAYGNKDSYSDIIRQGACAKFLKDNGPKFPILNNHNSYDQIGFNLEAEENSKGLKVLGQINLLTQSGLERYSLAKQAQEIGEEHGLSIGFSSVREEYDKEKGIRYLIEIKLWEYSLVTWPANDKARVGDVKYLELIQDKKFMEGFIKELKSMGYSMPTISESARQAANAGTSEQEIKKLLCDCTKLFKSFAA